MENIKKDEFWVIKVINKDGTRGYLMDTPNGLHVITDSGVLGDITQFATYQDAQKFIRERKVERKGVRAYIRDNNDLMKDEFTSMVAILPEKPVYYLENHKGEKLYYEAPKELYYFKNVDVGYPCWYNEKEVREFVKHYKFEQSQIFMIKNEGVGKETRTLIQVYGSQKNEDGTMSEPKHYEINEPE